MPNPVRAARKEGRAKLKETKNAIKGYKQSEKAAKVTAKYNAKADAKGAKLRAAQKAAEKSKYGEDAGNVTKMESKKAPSLSSDKEAKLVKASPATIPTTSTKKSAKKTTSKRSMDKKGSALASVEQAKREKLERGISRKTVELTLAQRDKAKAEEEKKKEQLKKRIRAGAIAASPLGPVSGAASYLLPASSKKEMGGAASKPSYKKGGYMMSTKKKKK